MSEHDIDIDTIRARRIGMLIILGTIAASSLALIALACYFRA